MTTTFTKNNKLITGGGGVRMSARVLKVKGKNTNQLWLYHNFRVIMKISEE